MLTNALTSKTLAHTVTIGNFDGTHIGHQALLEATSAYAKAHSLPSLVITFDPHPAFVLPQRGKEPPLARLTDITERVRLLKSYGIAEVLVVPFTMALAAMSPAEFFQDILCDQAHSHAIFLGYDFALGRDRAGCTNTLMELGASFDIAMHKIEAVSWGGASVSSTRIRKSLLDGAIVEANNMLGRPYRLKGSVVHGHGRGRTIGVPTANLSGITTLIPKRGVYATMAQYINADGKMEKAPAVTSVGFNPTFTDSSTAPLCVETHILHKNVDLYDKELSIEFIAHLRKEQKFPSVEALIAQIKADIATALQLF